MSSPDPFRERAEEAPPLLADPDGEAGASPRREPEDGSEERGSEALRKRRPGCLRRWLVRPVVWLLVVVLVLVAVVALYVQSNHFEDRMQALVEERASQALGRRVTLGDLDLNVVGLVATAHRVRVAGAGPEAPPFFTARRLEVDLSILQLVWTAPTRAHLRLDQVSLEEPRLRLSWDAEGQSNLPGFSFGEEEGGSAFQVRLGRLLVERGELVYEDARVPLSFDAQGVLGTLSGGELGGDSSLDFRLSSEALTSFRLPGADRPFSPSASFEGRLWEDRLEIHRGGFRGSPDNPLLDADVSGHIAWGEEPVVDLQVEGTVDGAWAHRLGYLEFPLSGLVEVTEGRVVWNPRDWRWGGRWTVDRLVFLDRTFRAVDGSVAGDTAEVRVDVDSARFAEGELSGSWVLDRVSGEAADGPQRLRAEVRRMSLAALLDEIDVPVEGLAGYVSGEMSYRFAAAAPLAGHGEGRLRLEPRTRSTAGRAGEGDLRTLEGEIPMAVVGGQLAIAGARLSNPATTATVDALYDLERGTAVVRYLLSTEDLPRSLGAIDLTWMQPGLELGPAGHLQEGRGTVGGTLDVAPGELFGRMELELTEVATDRLSVDRVEGSLEHAFDPGSREPGAPVEALRLTDLSLRAEKGAGELSVTGSAEIPRAEDAEPGYRLEVALAEWPAGSVAPLVPLDLEVEGGLTGHFRVAGTGSAPRVEGSVRAAPFQVAGIDLQRATAELDYRDGVLRLEELTAELPAGTVEAVATIDFGEEQLVLSAGAPSLELARVQQLRELPGDLAGSLVLDLHVAGPFADLAGELALRGEGLSLGGTPLGQRGEAQLVAAWHEGEVEVGGSLLGILRFDGGGRLDGETVDLALAVASEHLGELVELTVPSAPRVDGSFEGRLTLTGDPAATGGLRESLAARLVLDQLELIWQERRIHNLEPVVAELSGGVLDLQSVFLGGGPSGTELFVSGQVELTTAEPSLDLRFQTSVAAPWLELALADLDVDLEGTFQMLATVRGTVAAPRINGQGELRGGQVLLPGFPHSLEQVDAIVLFDPGVVLLDSFRARFAGGDLKAAGRVRLPRGELPSEYTLQAQGTDLTLRYPEGWTLRGDTTVTLRSLPAAGGRELQGAVTLDRAIYVRDVPVGLFQMIQGALQRQRLALRETDELLSTTQLSISVEGEDALRVRNNVADLRGDISLSLQGSLARPVVFGQVEVEPGGELQFHDNDYTVERGLLTFANPYRVDPVIDLVATTELRRFDIQLALSGTLDRLNANFSSNPPLADLEVLGLIATGTGPNRGQDQGGVAERFLFGQAASALSKRVNTLFGFDKFRIEPGGGGEELLSGLGFSLEKRLSRDVVVIFARDPTSTEREILQIEWEVAAGVTLILSRESDGSFAVDGRWEKTF